ncbi:PREDICTED: MLO-like protein 13 isoform X1 [Theobroma cacao]|uniref:MLO-like protein n=1 Tax=Theobroma cacao TaxID=3641 RepID=A0AB32X0A6_THECC|nr:PREDICTED: MLO-like protein 13 isoform X1 [Theobroma cacao]
MAESRSLEYKPTWVVAAVCFVIILICLFAERGLNHLGKWLRRNKQDALFEALQKLKAELMLLGFISLLLNVFQGLISQICIPTHLESSMLPCKKHTESKSHKEFSSLAVNGHLLFSADSSSEHCSREGKVPLLSTEAFHQLHILIFVVAVVHVVSCAIILVLGGARIREWKPWEEWISKVEKGIDTHNHHLQKVLEKHAWGYWRKAAVVSWTMSFFKQFHSPVTLSEYIALRDGFIMTHCPDNREYDFHKYMTLSLERDFRHVVGISWYQWLFVVVFLTLNVEGWHAYFWLSFLPVVLLLLVGAKLEHIIVRLAQDVDEMKKLQGREAAPPVKPSDEYFWFNRPRIVLHFIHFILFQNAFEIAFFFWILWTYGFHSCIMGRKGYIITRLIMGVIAQGLCSYITLPLYALVTKMGTSFEPVQLQLQSSINI